MGDLLKGIEYLGIPATVAIVLVAIFLIFQIIGEITEVCGKVVPEFLKVRKYFSRKKKEKEETKEMIQKCTELLSQFNSHYSDDNISKRNKWMNGIDTSVKNNDQLVHTLDAKMDKILKSNEDLKAQNEDLKAQNEDLKTQLDQVKSNVLENEADRLRSELFDCGNRCRRKIRLHPEEMDHMREVYHKYSNVLHQNGPGEAEFQFITNYYNHQDFPTYHQPNE